MSLCVYVSVRCIRHCDMQSSVFIRTITKFLSACLIVIVCRARWSFLSDCCCCFVRLQLVV